MLAPFLFTFEKTFISHVMKKFLLVVFFVSATLFVDGQTAEMQTKSVRLEMISAFSNKLGVNIEHYKNNSSFVLNFGATLPTDKTTRYVFEIFPEYRKYFRHDNTMDGWYIGPHLRYRQVREDNKYSTQSFGAGVFFGYQINIIGGFVANIYLGPDYAFGNLELHDGIYDSDNVPYPLPEDYKGTAEVPLYEGVLINGGISLGISF